MFFYALINAKVNVKISFGQNITTNIVTPPVKMIFLDFHRPTILLYFMDNLNFPMEDFSLEHVFAAILPSNLCALKAEPIYIVSNIFL